MPAFCFGARVNKVVEDLSLLTATHHFSVQLLSLSAANCILYVAVVAYSSLHQITKSSAYNAALTVNSVCRDSCPEVVEVGFYPVEHVAGSAIPQQFDE